MNFLRSQYTWLLIIVPILFLIWVLYRRWKIKLLESFFSHQFKKTLIKKRMSWVQISLISISMFFSIVALMGPKLGHRWEKVETKGVDIIISLDISKSMDVKDIPPSRLKRSKLAIADLLSQAEGDRFGLVTFAGEAVKNSPLSQDYDV